MRARKPSHHISTWWFGTSDLLGSKQKVKDRIQRRLRLRRCFQIILPPRGSILTDLGLHFYNAWISCSCFLTAHLVAFPLEPSMLINGRGRIPFTESIGFSAGTSVFQTSLWVSYLAAVRHPDFYVRALEEKKRGSSSDLHEKSERKWETGWLYCAPSQSEEGWAACYGAHIHSRTHYNTVLKLFNALSLRLSSPQWVPHAASQVRTVDGQVSGLSAQEVAVKASLMKCGFRGQMSLTAC
jgi:hypothetical protein